MQCVFTNLTCGVAVDVCMITTEFLHFYQILWKNMMCFILCFVITTPYVFILEQLSHRLLFKIYTCIVDILKLFHVSFVQLQSLLCIKLHQNLLAFYAFILKIKILCKLCKCLSCDKK